MRGISKIVIAAAIAAVPAFCQGWNPKLAAQYLDSREEAWNAWPTAKAASGGTCFSCHTNMTYLIARPVLRHALGEAQPTRFEKAALDGLRARVSATDAAVIKAGFAKEPLASQALGVEAIFAALFLGLEDLPAGKMSPATEQAFDRLWKLQIASGRNQGAWSWFELDLDPWETQASPFYGATLAAMAVAVTPEAYRQKSDVKEHVAALQHYLKSAAREEPLHNRMMLLWTVTLSTPERANLANEILGRQQSDGGWTLESLGPWKPRTQAAALPGSNAYATGMAALGLLKANVPPSNPKLAQAIEWLTKHQTSGGYWEAGSMNKHYEADSMQDGFMRDAATAFASLALLEAEKAQRP